MARAIVVDGEVAGTIGSWGDPDEREVTYSKKSCDRPMSIPVLALTAQAMHGDRERFLAAAFDDYISRPVNTVELLATVRRYCETQDS